MDGRLRQHLEAKYSIAAVNDREKLVEALVDLMEHGRDQSESLGHFLDRAARLISRLLGFEEVVIGLYDRNGTDYYHEVVLGYRSDISAGLKQLRYKDEDMVSQRRFPSVRIGKLSEFYPVEGLPEPERKLFDVPSTGTSVRRILGEFRRGDFIGIWMRDQSKNLVGWIRVSRPRIPRFPPKINVLWLEFIASICACVVSRRWHHEDRARRSVSDER